MVGVPPGDEDNVSEEGRWEKKYFLPERSRSLQVDFCGADGTAGGGVVLQESQGERESRHGDGLRGDATLPETWGAVRNYLQLTPGKGFDEVPEGFVGFELEERVVCARVGHFFALEGVGAAGVGLFEVGAGGGGVAFFGVGRRPGCSSTWGTGDLWRSRPD